MKTALKPSEQDANATPDPSLFISEDTSDFSTKNKTIVICYEEACVDIVGHFYSFLVANTFNSNVVADAFRSIADEVDPLESIDDCE